MVNTYLDPNKNNPLSPIPSCGNTRTYRLNTDTNPFFLESPVKMSTRCSRCHRYKKAAPSPELGHDGSQAESKCRLDHHPCPCDYVDDNGDGCNFNFEKVTATSEADSRAYLESQMSAQAAEMRDLKGEMAELRRLLGSLRTGPSPSDSLASLPPQNESTTVTQSLFAPVPSLLQPPTAAVTSCGRGTFTSEAQKLIDMNEKSGTAYSALPSYGGPSMKDLQHDPSIAAEVQRQLNDIITRTPALHKVVAGQNVTDPTAAQHMLGAQGPPPQVFQGGVLGTQRLPPQVCPDRALDGQGLGRPLQHNEEINLLDMDTMLGLTVREKQYRPHEFASRGNFFYAKNINERNVTLPLYVYGYLKHCIILMSGLVPVAEGEVMARLVNLMNIMEITSNNSTLNDFDHPAWQLGKGYGDRVFNDIQQGHRNWLEMPNNILPDVFLHVKDMVDIQKKKDTNNPRGRGRGGGRGRGAGQERSDKTTGEKPLVCTTYNDFFTGSGCAYEFNNQRKCTYEHYCSKCFAANGTKLVHKARLCTAPVTTTSG